MFQHLNKSHFKIVFNDNIRLFKKQYGWIIFTIILQLWHNIATNIAYYVHQRGVKIIRF